MVQIRMNLPLRMPMVQETEQVKVGDMYYSFRDIDPATSKPMTGKTEKYKVENGKVVSANGSKTEVT